MGEVSSQFAPRGKPFLERVLNECTLPSVQWVLDCLSHKSMQKVLTPSAFCGALMPLLSGSDGDFKNKWRAILDNHLGQTLCPDSMEKRTRQRIEVMAELQPSMFRPDMQAGLAELLKDGGVMLALVSPPSSSQFLLHPSACICSASSPIPSNDCLPFPPPPLPPFFPPFRCRQE